MEQSNRLSKLLISIFKPAIFNLFPAIFLANPSSKGVLESEGDLQIWSAS
jgi:hypothetical protein